MIISLFNYDILESETDLAPISLLQVFQQVFPLN